MDFDRIVAELSDFATGYVEVSLDSAPQPDVPPDLARLIEPGFLADVTETLRMILELPPEVAAKRAPIAAALIVLEFARRQAEREADALENLAVDAALRNGHHYPDSTDAGEEGGVGVGLLLLSPIDSETTGIDGAVVWASAGEFLAPDPGLGPRIVIMPGDNVTTEGLSEAAAVRLLDPPEVVGELPQSVRQQAVEFAVGNRDALLRHWNGEIAARELLDLLEQAQSVRR